MRTLPVSAKLVRGRLSEAVVLALLAMLFTLPLVLLGTARDSTIQARINGLIGERGGENNLVVDTASQAAQNTVRRLPGAVAMTYDTVVVGHSGARTGAGLRVFSSTSLPIHHLDDGRRPEAKNEVAVSEAVRAQLGLQPGMTIDITTPKAPARAVQVVGIVSNPSSASDSFVLAVDPSIMTTASMFVVPTSSTGDWLDIQALTVSGISADIAAVYENPPPLAAAASRLLGSLVVPLVLGVVGGAWTASGRIRRDMTALMEAGASPRATVRIVQKAAGTVLVVGSAVGVLTAVGLAHLTARPLSHLIGQDWVDLTLPWRLIVLVVLAGPVAVLVAPWIVRGARRLWSRPLAVEAHRPVRIWPALVLLTGAVAALSWSGLSSARVDEAPRIPAALLGCLGIVLALAVIVPAVTGVRAAPATRWVVRRLARQVRVPLIAAVVIAGAGSLFVSVETSGAAQREALYGGESQERGSLLVNDLPLRSTAEVASLPGVHHADVYWNLRHDGRQLWVVPGGACISSDDCPLRAPIAAVALSPDVPSGTAIARPDLIRAGKVGIVSDDPATGRGAPVGEVPARPDVEIVAAAAPQLGESLPGAALATDHPLVKTFGLQTTGMTTMLLRDVSAADTAAVTASVRRIAPNASVDRDVQAVATEQMADVARSVAAGAAVVAGCLAALAVAGILIGQRALRARLADLGAAPRVRRSLGVRIFGLYALAGLLALPVVAVTSDILTFGPGDAPPDASWLGPPLALFAVLVAGALLMQRQPRNESGA